MSANTIDERGSALVVTLLAMVLMVAFGSALVLVSTAETRISAYERRAAGALYAADGVLALAVAELSGIADWDAVLRGDVSSSLADGAPSGLRAVSGTTIDLDAVTHELRCGRTTACSAADLVAMTSARPWGVNNPLWQLYAWGPLRHLAPSTAPDGDVYLLVWVADDPDEVDGDPRVDDPAAANPGRGRITLAAHAYGPGGVRRAIEATIARDAAAVTASGASLPPTRLIAWREVR